MSYFVREIIYVASKSRHGPMWRAFRDSGVPILADWIDQSGPGETGNWAELWTTCVEQASTCRSTVLYREPGDVLKGALVEAGAAMASGRVVYGVGCGDYTFAAHPLFVPCRDLREALDLSTRSLRA